MRKIPNINTHIFKQPRLPWSVSGFSTEATAAFALYDSLGDGLTEAEKTAMAVYIDAEVANSNHTKKDYEVIMPLSGNNSLVDYIGGKVATLVNAPTHSISGYAFNGTTQHYNTNFTPNIDASNLAVGDALVSFFLTSNNDETGHNKLYWGVTSGSDHIRFLQSASFSRVELNVLGATGRDANRGFVPDATTYATGSNGSVGALGFIDGVSIPLISLAYSATALPALPFYIGATNVDGSAANWHAITVGAWTLSSESGFSHSGYNTNIRALLTSLGTI